MSKATPSCDAKCKTSDCTTVQNSYEAAVANYNRALLWCRAGAVLARAEAPFADEYSHHDIDDNTITLGANHACAIEAVEGLEVGGEVVCWGNGARGQLESPSEPMMQISAGGYTTCGVTIEGRVRCWGGSAELLRAVATATASDSRMYLQVSVGEHHVCGVTADGELRCFGDNDHKELLAPEGLFVQVSCGLTSSCALRTDGRAVCFGTERKGALVPPDVRFVQISLSRTGRACAIGVDSKLYCWQPGAPVQSWNGTYLQVASGRGVACAIAADATLFCVGEVGRLWNSKGAPPRDTQFEELTTHGLNMCGIIAGANRRAVCFGEDTSGMQPPDDLELVDTGAAAADAEEASMGVEDAGIFVDSADEDAYEL